MFSAVNESNEDEGSYELKTELVSCSFNVENKKTTQFPSSTTTCSSTSDTSFSGSEIAPPMTPEYNFEDELFGQQDSDLSFVTTWDPLLDFDKENSCELNWSNSDLEVNCAGESPTNIKSVENLGESPLRALSPLVSDDKSPEFVKQNVCSYYGRCWNWK